MPGAFTRPPLILVLTSVLVASTIVWATACGTTPAKPAPPPSTTTSAMPTAAVADRPAPSASRFGVHLAGHVTLANAPLAANVRGLGAGWLRANIVWNEVERTEGRYDWSIPDAIVQQVTAHDVSLLLQLRGYSGGGAAPLPKNPLYASDASARRSGYERFLRETVRRYRATVQTWQIENEITGGNEVNPNQFWIGSIEEYADVMHAAYRVIKEEDPGARVLLAGIAADTEIDWMAADPAAASRDRGAMDKAARLDLMLRRSAGAYDILDVHVYRPARIEYVRARMAASGDRKPIWVTETGGPDTGWPYTPVAVRGRPNLAYREQPTARIRGGGGTALRGCLRRRGGAGLLALVIDTHPAAGRLGRDGALPRRHARSRRRRLSAAGAPPRRLHRRAPPRAASGDPRVRLRDPARRGDPRVVSRTDHDLAPGA